MKNYAPKSFWRILVIALTMIACRKPPTRDQVLVDLISHTVMPTYDLLVTEASVMTAEATAFSKSPTADGLDRFRADFRNVCKALKGTYAFRTGPIDDEGLHLRHAYWPIRPASIDALLAARPLNEAAVKDAGAAGKGLYALEHLLFEPDAAGKGAMLLGPQAATRRSLAQLLAADFEQAARRVNAAALRIDLPTNFAARGVEGLGRVVNDLLETVETVVTGRLEYVARLKTMQSLGRGRLEGEPSGTSLLSTQAMLGGARAMYLGQGSGVGGLSALVQAAAPAVDKDVRAAFEAASQSLAAMQDGLEAEIVRHPDRLWAAREACHRLELALKTGVLSALGVTLLFRSTDGD